MLCILLNFYNNKSIKNGIENELINNRRNYTYIWFKNKETYMNYKDVVVMVGV
jgi:hypothetical protein